MRYLLLILTLLFPFLCSAQAGIKPKEYSWTQLFDMIEAEESAVFRLENARIVVDSQTDSLFRLDASWSGINNIQQFRVDTIHVYKHVEFTNVDFNPNDKVLYGFSLMTFHETVNFQNCLNPILVKSTFQDVFKLGVDNILNSDKNGFSTLNLLIENVFKSSINVVFFAPEFYTTVIINNNKVNGKSAFFNQVGSRGNLVIRNNDVTSNQVELFYRGTKSEILSNYELINNSFNSSGVIKLSFSTDGVDFIKVARNNFNSPVAIEVDNLMAASSWIQWTQFQNNLIHSEIYRYWFDDDEVFDLKGFVPGGNKWGEQNRNHYLDTVRVQDIDVYNAELALRGRFYNYYKSRHETEAANAVYEEIKDIETQRLAFLYNQNPGFTTFFKWKINQFLKLFSGYGTEPARAITMSVYVVLAFALVYLFFPNHWDSHGKNRIMDRYRFFLKYVNKDSGMHEVYLDEKQPELLASEDFKRYLQEQGKTAPKFFMATALPLYRWSIAGTKSASWLLSKVDVLKGKWSETEDSKKGGKSFLLITAFLIALLYDIFIKMLNALMLSINTFTTLGFGEIPIKGLPRYLAIIQGFIGWFMLTIFSVSLISQLLN
ncbi:potassium channel family protein [Roseivirga sp. E12]|uniref:potassium channel family protein n=1 Tax=Roseivirga sp. E12 TaxID=2819237 RepID=UPI001ABC37D1|nr:potassium channel family protein [Roseivirga sp. E12]MBO3697696.1 two pore domain potassium channel family protein [Roseivirga sp. E12]